MSAISRPTMVPEVVYPDSDGRPMADNTIQYRWIVLIKEGLEYAFRDREDVFIAGDLLWYPVEGDRNNCMAPDVLVALDRPKGDRGSYRQWVEGGIPPHVVFEVHSPNNTPAEMARKLRYYDRYGVREYYYYDPETGKLSGWKRDEESGRLRRIARINAFRSPLLRIQFQVGSGRESLTILGPDDQPFISPLTSAQQRDEARRQAKVAQRRARAEIRKAQDAEKLAQAERQKAQAEREKAQAERQKAQAERDRADRLAARLRELGIEPE
ncbi:Uma2 family endonuclease [Aquisphaera insulae]|uniref:Uma2 family endonuclease n=1 Tax=Aquisphaera insulae TaxID=2712864 RepID=UPI0013EA26CA|nr:Uma2 family endonuclease [Aquisphaera insulae]